MQPGDEREEFAALLRRCLPPHGVDPWPEACAESRVSVEDDSVIIEITTSGDSRSFRFTVRDRAVGAVRRGLRGAYDTPDKDVEDATVAGHLVLLLDEVLWPPVTAAASSFVFRHGRWSPVPEA